VALFKFNIIISIEQGIHNNKLQIANSKFQKNPRQQFIVAAVKMNFDHPNWIAPIYRCELE